MGFKTLVTLGDTVLLSLFVANTLHYYILLHEEPTEITVNM